MVWCVVYGVVYVARVLFEKHATHYSPLVLVGSSFNAALQSETASENLDNLIAKDRPMRVGWNQRGGWR